MRNSLLPFFLAAVMLLIGCVSDATATPTILPSTPSSIPSITPTAVPIIDTLTGSLRNQINNLEDKMPRADSESYSIPTRWEQVDFATLVSALESDNLENAVFLATRNDYTLNYYVDRGDDKAVNYLLREKKPVQKGWGLYVFRVDSSSNIIIEAPHPLHDKRTPSIALDIYRALDAHALLIAGTHRNANSDGSADVAHASESIFESIHAALVQEIQTASEDAIILQIHGFHTSKHEGYPQVVFGFGEIAQAEEIALAQKIETALADQGMSAGLCMGDALQDLCARTNIQGAGTNAGLFIHLELDESIRRNDEAFIAALVQVFSK